MKSIQLTQNKTTFVSNKDYVYLSQWQWYAHYHRGKWYACRNDGDWRVKQIRIYMHREIMKPPEGMEVDHKNGDGLYNLRSNLRVCTRNQNGQNQKLSKANTTGYKGVTFHKSTGKYRAYIKTNHKQIHIGMFTNIIEAAKAYDEMAKKIFGKFARTNL